MKRLRFFLILNRGPPMDKGVFTGFPPRKNAPCLSGDVAERLLHPAVNRRSQVVASRSQTVPPSACGFKSRHPRHLLPSFYPGLAELADALGLGPSWGCPVGRSPSPCEFKSRAPDHSPCTPPRIFRSIVSFYLTQCLALSKIIV